MLADEAAPQKGWTPLHYASKEDQSEMVQALLAKGADVDGKAMVSIARTSALYPSHGYIKGMYLNASPAVSQDGAAAARLERHSAYAPGSVRLWPTARHGPQ